MKSGAPAPAPVPFFARKNPGLTLTVRSGLQAGEPRVKATEEIGKTGG